MFDAPLQLQGILLQSFQPLCTLAFVLGFCVNACARVVRIFFRKRSYRVQWNLYDNCAAGNINYAFSLFTVSSHHLPGSRCKVRWKEPALCCTTLYLRDLYSPQLSVSPHALKSRGFHYVYLRYFGKFQLLLSKHDNSSLDVWCCSTMRCFTPLELLTCTVNYRLQFVLAWNNELK